MTKRVFLYLSNWEENNWCILTFIFYWLFKFQNKELWCLTFLLRKIFKVHILLHDFCPTRDKISHFCHYKWKIFLASPQNITLKFLCLTLILLNECNIRYDLLCLIFYWTLSAHKIWVFIQLKESFSQVWISDLIQNLNISAIP